jgi:ADP-ribose pyrophosphatase
VPLPGRGLAAAAVPYSSAVSDSPARRRPTRRATGIPVVDALLDQLREADETLEERVLERNLLHVGRFMTFEHARITRAGGESERDIVVHPGAVVIAPVDAKGHLLMVIQYRLPAGGAMLELPAGTLDVHDGAVEDPLLAAHRELEEETGYRAGSMEKLGGFWSAPGFSTEYLTLFVARDLVPATDDRLEPDEDENLRLVRLPWRDAVTAVKAGIVEDAKSVAGILWLADLMGDAGS